MVAKFIDVYSVSEGPRYRPGYLSSGRKIQPVRLSDCLPGREALDIWARGAAVPSPLQLGMGVWMQKCRNVTLTRSLCVLNLMLFVLDDAFAWLGTFFCRS